MPRLIAISAASLVVVGVLAMPAPGQIGYGGVIGSRPGFAGPLDYLATPSANFRSFSPAYGLPSYGLPYSYYGYRYPYGAVPGPGSWQGPYGYQPLSVPVDKRARLRIRLPAENAEVWLDGQKTKQKGLVRDYISPPLESGFAYTYQVRVTWMEKGKAREQTRTVPLIPNRRQEVDFTKANGK